MSWLWGGGTNTEYEELVEKACSPLKLPYPQGEDIALNLEVTDMIRSKAVAPKPAMQALKARIGSKNGRVQMYALSLADTCIKNGGDHFLAEVASREFTDELAGVIKNGAAGAEVRTMAAGLLQQWALAFRSKPALSYLPEVYSELKASGVRFPPPPASAPADTLLETATAPAWADADACMRCRTAFTFTNRKHHCRACGLVFCGECSAKTMPLPRFGIKEPVRVCEACFAKGGRAQPAPAVPGRTPRSRRDFDADLQRAIELSLQSAPGAAGAAATHQPSEPPLAGRADMSEDEQLRLAIEASLRDMEAAPSAPAGEEPEWRPLPTFDLAPREVDTLLTFTNTMEQMTAYGERDLARFPHAAVLHAQAAALAPQLARNYEEKSTKKAMLAEMQAKLSEAVTLYGSILDGQAAYEQQQRQAAYAQTHYVPPQQYANGAAYQPYAPQYAQPQQQQAYAPYAPQYATAASTNAGSSHMYPAMPQQQAYAPPQWQPQQAQQQQWAPQPASRQASYAAPLEPQHTHASQASYAAPQPAQSPPAQGYYQPLQVSAEPQTYGAGAPDPALPSAPPQASAPELSPAAQPSAPLASPSAPPASAPTSPVKSLSALSPQQSPALYQPQQQHQWQQQPPQQQQQPPQQHQQQPPQQQQQQQQQQPQQQGFESQWQHPGYTPAMFPSAPSTLPEPAPKQEAPKEALLIEL